MDTPFAAVALALCVAAPLAAQERTLDRRLFLDELSPRFEFERGRLLGPRGPRDIAAGGATLAVDVDEILVVPARDAATPRSAPARGVTPLPFTVLRTVPGADPAAPPVVVAYTPEVEFGGPLFPSDGGYAGTVAIRLASRTAADAADLPSAVRITVIVNGGAAAPDQLAIVRINTFKRVDITLPDPPPRDSTLVLLVDGVDDAKSEWKLPVSRARRTLSISPARIYGAGLEAATVSIRGDPSIDADRTFQLESTAGTLESTSVQLDGSAQGSTSLRSKGLGQAVVTIVGIPQRGVRATARFVFPLGFLLVTLAGALVGSFAAALKRASAKAGFGRHLAAGTAMGVVAAAVWAFGIRDLLAFSVPDYVNEVGGFAIAALGGLGVALKIRLPGSDDGPDR